MPFVQVPGIGSATEPEIAPEGPAHLRITKAEMFTAKRSGRPCCRVLMVFMGEEGDNFRPISNVLTFATADDDEELAKRMTLNLRRFCELFEVPYSDGSGGEPEGFDTDDLVNAEATVMVTQTQPDDEGNIYNDIRLPRLASE